MYFASTQWLYNKYIYIYIVWHITYILFTTYVNCNTSKTSFFQCKSRESNTISQSNYIKTSNLWYFPRFFFRGRNLRSNWPWAIATPGTAIATTWGGWGRFNMFIGKITWCTPSPNERIRPLKRDFFFFGHFTFQPSIFRGYVSFQGGVDWHKSPFQHLHRFIKVVAPPFWKWLASYWSPRRSGADHRFFFGGWWILGKLLLFHQNKWWSSG